MEPILLTESFLSEVISRKNVQAEFPYIKDKYNLTKGKKSSCCDGGHSQTKSVIGDVKNYILGLPPERIQKLKELLRIPLERKIKTYIRKSNNRLEKIEL